VTLNGHTAATGKTTKAKNKYRQQLANNRALAVEDYLKSSLKKFNSNVTIKTNAQGALNPLGSNENESGRKKNRRVEISIN
jgi:outer membrane protein OmpA-like peptidoglycan-associated protein